MIAPVFIGFRDDPLTAPGTQDPEVCAGGEFGPVPELVEAPEVVALEEGLLAARQAVLRPVRTWKTGDSARKSSAAIFACRMYDPEAMLTEAHRKDEEVGLTLSLITISTKGAARRSRPFSSGGGVGVEEVEEVVDGAGGKATCSTSRFVTERVMSDDGPA